MKKTILKIFLICGISFILISWGSVGHNKISQETSLSFPISPSFLQIWCDSLAINASNADIRKQTDPMEQYNHYIDIDSYPEFIANGTIPSTYDSVVNIHGQTFVTETGILPWATLTYYDSLVMAFQAGDMHQAMLYASDIGHYVADGHMPLHITTNYNGQFTGQYGIHSRYESTMIGTYISQINYVGSSVNYIPNVNNYIFNYLYINEIYVDSVLAADTYATNLAGGSTTSSTYKTALWNKTKNFTTLLFKNASHAIAELIYTAWLESTGVSSNSNTSQIVSNFNVFPNPVQSSTTINFNLQKNSNVQLKITDITGKQVFISNQFFESGEQHFDLETKDYKNGIYFCTLTTGNLSKSIRIAVIH